MKRTGNRRIFAGLLTLALLLCSLPVPARAEGEYLGEYSDLNPDEWYAQGVDYCIAHGMMDGYGDDLRLFGPYDPMTRSQLITVLWRIAGEPETGLMSQHIDVPEAAWYEKAVRWSVAAGIMDGYSDYTFGPDDPLIREQLVTVLWRFVRWKNGAAPVFSEDELQPYSDRFLISDYALEAMSWACGLDILTGVEQYGAQWITPRVRVTRASFATILMRFCLDMGYCEKPVS